MYDPSTGRFLSEDPIEYLGGDANLTRYVGNSPTNFVDPSGLVGGGSWVDENGQSHNFWIPIGESPEMQQGFYDSILPTTAASLAITGGAIAVVSAPAAVGGFVASEVAETAFEEVTGVPVLLDPLDLLEAGGKRVGRSALRQCRTVTPPVTSESVEFFSGRFARLNPDDLLYSQRTAGQPRPGRIGAEGLLESMRKGWNGRAIDAVETPSGIVVIDNTRAAVARELRIPEIPVMVRNGSDPLPESMLGRFGSAKTWGEALNHRMQRQNPPLSSGTATPPLFRRTSTPCE